MTYHGTRSIPHGDVFLHPGPILDGQPTLIVKQETWSEGGLCLWPGDDVTLYFGEDKPLVRLIWHLDATVTVEPESSS